MACLDGRIALITGASRGLGAAVAERFAVEGAELILVARTTGGLEETDDRVRAAGSKATLVPLDLMDGAAIDQLGAAIAQRWGRLDVLVGNAAILGPLGPAGHCEPKLWDEVFRLNVTANWHLIRSVDVLLRASDAGRAIFVTSRAARRVKAYWAAYAASKAALEALAKSYAGELEKTAVKVNLLDPGITRTRMRAEAMPGEDPAVQAPPEEVARAFVALADAACSISGQIVEAQTARD